MKLSDFRVLTFDCYGTLIDWEAGLLQALEPVLGKAIERGGDQAVLAAFARHEADQEGKTPNLPYSQLLAVVLGRLADEFGISLKPGEPERFGASVPRWPAFSDSSMALQYLKRHYKLVILSNIDRESFRGSNAQLAVEFDAIYTAQDIGSYKPDPRNFAYMLRHLESEHSVHPREVLHVAQSLFHDHIPANRAGLASAWIDRRHATSGWGATPPPEETARYDFCFPSMSSLVAAHQSEVAGGAA